MLEKQNGSDEKKINEGSTSGSTKVNSKLKNTMENVKKLFSRFAYIALCLKNFSNYFLLISINYFDRNLFKNIIFFN